MQNKFSVSKYLLLAGLFAAGTGAGYLLGHKGRERRPAATGTVAVSDAPSRTYAHLNPLVYCSGQDNTAPVIRLGELISFRPEIERYIGQATAKHPELHIAYYFRDLTNGIWIGLNEREKFSPASLFKIPLMLAVLKKAETDPALLQMRVRFDKKDFEGIQEEAGYAKEDGKEYSVEELLDQMIDYSDNAAALILIKLVGEDQLKEVERNLNLSIPANANANTNFVMVKSYGALFRILYNAAYLNRDMSEKALSLLLHARFTGGIRAGVPDSIGIAHKYGIRDVSIAPGVVKAGYQYHHFGIVYYPGKPYLIGVMARGDKKEVKEEVIRELSAITFRNVDRQLRSHPDRPPVAQE